MVVNLSHYVFFCQKAELIKSMVGLRPVREKIRLEKEVMDVSTQYGTKIKLQVGK